MIDALNLFAGQIQPLYQDGDPTVDQKSLELDTITAVERFYRAAASGNPEQMSATISDDIEFHLHGPAEFEWAASCVGKIPYFETMAKNFSCVEDQVPQATGVVCQGDTAYISYLDEGTISKTGKRYKARGIHVLTIREGRISRMESILDTGSVMKAMQP